MALALCAIPVSTVAMALALSPRDEDRASTVSAPELASGYATAYLEQLRSDAVLADRFDDIQQVNLSRNPQNGRLAIEIFLKFKGLDKEVKKP